MPISPDVVASTLVDLMPKYSELFSQWHPVIDRIIKKGQRRKLQGPTLEFNVVTDGPGFVTEIANGSELITGGRRQNAVRGNEIAPRYIYATDIPAKDLAEANGDQDLARILKDYPELGLTDVFERIADQIATGDGAGLGGFLTLNGDTVYTPQAGAARGGILDFATPATQTGIVHGLNKATVAGWTNQYGLCTSFATDGKRTMRDVYFDCSRQGSRTTGDVDLILCDQDSYLNYLDDLDEQVRVAKIEGDKAPPKVRMGTKFLAADIFLEDALRPAATAFTGRNGVMYFLKTDTWNLFTLGGEYATDGFFEFRDPFRIPDQDVWRYELVWYLGMYCNQLRSNGVIEGTSVV